MVRNIHQQVLLLERLDNRRQHNRDDFQRRGRDRGLRDEYTGVEVVLRDVLRKGTHLFYANRGLRAEFNPDDADLSGGVRGGVGCGGVFFEH